MQRALYLPSRRGRVSRQTSAPAPAGRLAARPAANLSIPTGAKLPARAAGPAPTPRPSAPPVPTPRRSQAGFICGRTCARQSRSALANIASIWQSPRRTRPPTSDQATRAPRRGACPLRQGRADRADCQDPRARPQDRATLRTRRHPRRCLPRNRLPAATAKSTPTRFICTGVGTRGRTDAARLHAEIVELGHCDSKRTVRRRLQQIRVGESNALKRKQLLARCPELAAVTDCVRAFAQRMT